jgi:hypothetical protein
MSHIRHIIPAQENLMPGLFTLVGPERRRLDVAFTFVRMSPQKGAWIAIPVALSDPLGAGQALLPPGEYRVKLSVDCENGKGCTKEFFIVSPESWVDLSMRPVKG